MRYFAELSYKGTHYFGWQRQPGQLSIQQVTEEAFFTILRTPIEVVGCGRTDTGVHARQYFLHFDYDTDLPEGFRRRINKVLPADIAMYAFTPMPPTAHARYDAIRRSYTYYIGFDKNPFTTDTVYHYPFAQQLDITLLHAAARLLLDYKDFFPFCKSNSDVQHTLCELMDCRWVHDQTARQLHFHISANRFLRGMVRLIVGMCLNVSIGKLKIEEVKAALDNKTRLIKSWSVPAEGLFLTGVEYGDN